MHRRLLHLKVVDARSACGTHAGEGHNSPTTTSAFFAAAGKVPPGRRRVAGVGGGGWQPPLTFLTLPTEEVTSNAGKPTAPASSYEQSGRKGEVHTGDHHKCPWGRVNIPAISRVRTSESEQAKFSQEDSSKVQVNIFFYPFLFLFVRLKVRPHGLMTFMVVHYNVCVVSGDRSGRDCAALMLGGRKGG